MKKFAFWILFFGFGIFSNAQSSLPKNTSDSLWSIWTNQNLADTTRLDAMHKFTRDGYLSAKPDSAFNYAQLQYDFAQKTGIKKQMGFACNTQGAALYLKGDYDNALRYYKMSLTILEEINDAKGIGNALIGIGNIYKEQGNYSEAFEIYSKSLKIFEQTGNKAGMAVALHNIGINYKNQGEYILAIYYYEQSLKISEELGDRKSTSSTLGGIGLIYKIQGNYVKALEYYIRCLSIEEEFANKRGIASSWNSIGNLHKEQGDYILAIDYYSKSLMLYEELGSPLGIAATLSNLGIGYQETGELNKALDYYLRSLKIAQDNNNKKPISVALTNLAGFHRAKKEYDIAIEYYLQSIAIKEMINDKPGMTFSLNGIAICYFGLEDYKQSILFSQKGLRLAQELESPTQISDACRVLVNGYVQLNYADSAIVYISLLKNTLQQNLSTNYFTFSEHEKELYFATLENDFGKYFDFTLMFHSTFPNLADTAYNLALTNKGLSLKSSTAMRQIIADSEDSLLISDYENWLTLKKKIAKQSSSGLKNDLKALEEKANFLEKELVKRSNEFSDFEKIKNLDWKNVRSSLKPEECAVEFVHFNSELDKTNPVIYIALLIRPESVHPEIIRLCDESEIEEILGTFQGNNLSFVNKIYGTKQDAQKALYQKIWQPLEKHLDGIKTVYYSPSGLLHKISFASISKSQNVFLSDVYNFRQMSSTGKVAIPDDVAFGELENFLLMGGVKYNSDTTEKEIWNYLPGSLAETESINSFLKKKKFGVNYFKEGNASEAIFKEKIVSSSIVHIATHGFFFPDPEKVREEMKADSESHQDLKFRGSTNYANWSFVNNKNPLMRSGIVLAGANDVWQRNPFAEGEDGILTAQEVSNLDLRNTKLVVLSACETGLGDIKGSEGVFGLQRAFKMAGVKYLIMSLWQVPDKETSEFMILFYKNLIKIKDIPTAFQKTQKVMREKYDPYYWGAFVLIE